LSATLTTEPGGIVTVPGMLALVPEGPLAVKARLSGHVSAAALFDVALDPDALTLTASKDSLDYLTPQKVIFTVLYDGVALPAGTAVTLDFDPLELSGLSSSYALASGGTFTAEALSALVPEGPLAVAAGALGLASPRVYFGVDLLGGSLALSADTSDLGYLAPTKVVFTVTYQGAPLPAGTVVDLIFDPGELLGLSGSVALKAGGTFEAGQLTALVPDGPLSVQAGLGALKSPAASFQVDFDPGLLTMSLNPSSLELFVPTDGKAVFLYDGRPLPAGAAATLQGGDFENLPSSGLLDDSGSLALDDLTALATGTLEIEGTVLGHDAGKAEVEVHMIGDGLTGEVAVNPPGVKLVACVAHDVIVAVTYRGRPLAGTEVQITGFKFVPSSPVLTDSSGLVHGVVRFDANDEALLQAMGTGYVVGVSGISAPFPGPDIRERRHCD
jgi:hypothetical protein